MSRNSSGQKRFRSSVGAVDGSGRISGPFRPGHLRQILWNLCGNAVRYGQRKQGSVMLTVGREDNHVMLDIQDGACSEYRPTISHVYLSLFLRTSAQGTGLGLYIAKELCEANGANLNYRPRFFSGMMAPVFESGLEK